MEVEVDNIYFDGFCELEEHGDVFFVDLSVDL